MVTKGGDVSHERKREDKKKERKIGCRLWVWVISLDMGEIGRIKKERKNNNNNNNKERIG